MEAVTSYSKLSPEFRQSFDLVVYCGPNLPEKFKKKIESDSLVLAQMIRCYLESKGYTIPDGIKTTFEDVQNPPNSPVKGADMEGMFLASII